MSMFFCLLQGPCRLDIHNHSLQGTLSSEDRSGCSYHCSQSRGLRLNITRLRDINSCIKRCNYMLTQGLCLPWDDMNSIWIIGNPSTNKRSTAWWRSWTSQDSIEAIVPPVQSSIVVCHGVGVSDTCRQGSPVGPISIRALNFVQCVVGPVEHLIVKIHCDSVDISQIGAM